MKKDSGFIQIILIIVVIAIVLLFLGKNPLILWESIRPIFTFIFELFLNIVEWIITLLTRVWTTN